MHVNRLWALAIVALGVGLSSAATGMELWVVGGRISAGAGGGGIADEAVYHPNDWVFQQAVANAEAEITNTTYDGSGCTTHTWGQETCSLADWPGNQEAITHDGSVTATGPVEFYQHVTAGGIGWKTLVWGDIGAHVATRAALARTTSYAHGGDPQQPADTGNQPYSATVDFTVVGWGGGGGGMGMMAGGGEEGDLDGLLALEERS